MKKNKEVCRDWISLSCTFIQLNFIKPWGEHFFFEKNIRFSGGNISLPGELSKNWSSDMQK